MTREENGSASSPKTIFWQNGNLGPSGAHFREGYSIPYRAKITGLKGTASTPHTLIIEWDTKDQNGHALDYITHYDNLDNPVGSHQANFGHTQELVDPRLLTAFTGNPTLFQIPVPSSTGAEIVGQPGSSFNALPGASRTNNVNATKMAIWGGTIDSLVYLKQDNQDATTASTKTQLKISFKSANGTTALIAWGAHIAAEYDWGMNRGASKVSGSPYHMRVVTIDNKPGGQDRSLKASAVFVPPPTCGVSDDLFACEGSTDALIYSYTNSQAGITNYTWTLDPGTSGAKINGTAAGVNTVSGASITSVNIVPTGAGFTIGTFSISLSVTNLGGTAPLCSKSGTISVKATANAGANDTVCATSPAVTLAGSVGGGATIGTWTGGTDGGFNPNRTTLNATYTPTAAEILAGSVTLTLTSNDPTGPCGVATDEMVIVIKPTATANAGPNDTVCVSNPVVQLNGIINGGATTGSWSGGTDGSFNPDRNTLTSTYTPTAAEILAGSVTLTLTSNNPDGPCGVAIDDMVIKINPTATANAGANDTVCVSSPVVHLNGVINGGAATGSWSGGTDGSFNPDRNALNATYTPTAAEILTGSVTLTLTSNDPAGPCGVATDDMVIVIKPAATANAGANDTVCVSSPVVQLHGVINGGAETGSWSGGTDGSFNPGRTALNATYTPTEDEIEAGSVTLTLTSNDPVGPCGVATDDMVIVIKPAATANAGLDQTVCASSPAVTLDGHINGGAETGSWSGGTTSGFSPNRNTLNAIYTPTASEIAAGSVTLTLTSNDPTGPCGVASDDMVIHITNNPGRPAVTYIAPECDQTTFGIKVIDAVPGGIYKLKQVGEAEITKTTAGHADAEGDILFPELVIGKGFSVVLTVGDCTSDTTDCDNYKPQDEIPSAKKPLMQSAAKEEVSGTKVTAAPNPFNDKIRFTLKPNVTGRGSLELYNLLGEKVKTVFVGQVQKGQIQTIEYNVPYAQRTTLIYMFRVGNEKISGKLIGLK